MILNLVSRAWGVVAAMARARSALCSGRVFSAKKVKGTLASRAKRYLRRLVPCLVKAAAVISESSSGRRVLSD